MRRIRLKVAPKINPNVSRPVKHEAKSTSSETVPSEEQDPKEGEENFKAVEEINEAKTPAAQEPAVITQEIVETSTLESSFITDNVIQTITRHVESHFVEVVLPPAVESVESQTVAESEVPVSQVVAEEIPQKATAAADEHHQTVSRFKSRFARARPNIDGATHRVRTFSSASESEDEGRRMQRTRHLSVSALSKDIPTSKIALPKSPEKSVPEDVQVKTSEKPTTKKARYEKSDLQLRKEKVVKKLKEGKVDKSQLTMFDLIYYNPAGNGERTKISRRHSRASSSLDGTCEIVEERLAEEIEMEEMERETASGKENDEEADDEESSAMPVPQVRVGADGQLILDEQSLVVETSDAKAKKATMQNAEVVYENHQGIVNYGTWRKRKRSNRWDVKETARFYRALSMLGTDFSLMESLFPGRTRFELKKKFKLEERVNRDLIDRVIKNQKPFDPLLFGDESGASDDEEDEVAPSGKGKKTTPVKAKNKNKQAKDVPEEVANIAVRDETAVVSADE